MELSRKVLHTGLSSAREEGGQTQGVARVQPGISPSSGLSLQVRDTQRLDQEPTCVYFLGGNDVSVLISVTKKKNASVSSPW